jgi:hypothetical protein
MLPLVRIYPQGRKEMAPKTPVVTIDDIRNRAEGHRDAAKAAIPTAIDLEKEADRLAALFPALVAKTEAAKRQLKKVPTAANAAHKAWEATLATADMGVADAAAVNAAKARKRAEQAITDAELALAEPRAEAKKAETFQAELKGIETKSKENLDAIVGLVDRIKSASAAYRKAHIEARNTDPGTDATQYPGTLLAAANTAVGNARTAHQNVVTAVANGDRTAATTAAATVARILEGGERALATLNGHTNSLKEEKEVAETKAKSDDATKAKSDESKTKEEEEKSKSFFNREIRPRIAIYAALIGALVAIIVAGLFGLPWEAVGVVVILIAAAAVWAAIQPPTASRGLAGGLAAIAVIALLVMIFFDPGNGGGGTAETADPTQPSTIVADYGAEGAFTPVATKVPTPTPAPTPDS